MTANAKVLAEYRKNYSGLQELWKVLSKIQTKRRSIEAASNSNRVYFVYGPVNVETIEFRDVHGFARRISMEDMSFREALHKVKLYMKDAQRVINDLSIVVRNEDPSDYDRFCKEHPGIKVTEEDFNVITGYAEDRQ